MRCRSSKGKDGGKEERGSAKADRGKEDKERKGKEDKEGKDKEHKGKEDKGLKAVSPGAQGTAAPDSVTAAAEAGSPAVASAATVAPTSPTAPCSPASGPDLAAALEPTPDSSDQQAAQQVGQLLCQLVG